MHVAYGYTLPVTFLVIWIVFFMFLSASSYYGIIESNLAKGDIPWMGLIFILIGFVLLFFLIRVPKIIKVEGDIISFWSPLRNFTLAISEIEEIDISPSTSEDNMVRYIICRGGRKLCLHKNYKDFDQLVKYIKGRNENILLSNN